MEPFMQHNFPTDGPAVVEFAQAWIQDVVFYAATREHFIDLQVQRWGGFRAQTLILG